MSNETTGMRVRAAVSGLAGWAPVELAEPWDNVGWMYGNPDVPLTGTLVCLDLTEDCLVQARAQGLNLIVTHHPPVFTPLRAVTVDSWEGRMAGLCWIYGISVYSAHTNFDAAPGGLCDILAETLNLQQIQPFPGPGTEGFAGRGRSGLLSEAMDIEAFCRFLAEKLSANNIRLIGTAPESIARVVVQNGAYDRDLLQTLSLTRPDVLVTGDVKHHDALALREAGLFAVDAGHQATELPFCEAVARVLTASHAGMPVHVGRESPVYRVP